MTTMRDVAVEAGVSTATVSRVLSGRTDVDPEMTDRVKRAARALAYRPNPHGRALRKQRSEGWAVLVTDIENPFFTSIVRSLEEVALENGKAVTLCNTGKDVEREATYIKNAVQNQVSGTVIATASAARSDLSPLLEAQIPVVLIDRVAKRHPELDSVFVDNAQGANDATTHLVTRGYRRIGCLAGPADASTSEERLEGYRRALDQARLPAPPELVERSEFTPDGGLAAGRRLFERADRPDALFVMSARMAIGAIAAVREAGLEVGEDVGLVTFDDEPWTSLVTPPISVVRQPTDAIGALAARTLINALDGDRSEPSHVRLPCELVIRRSSTTRRPS